MLLAGRRGERLHSIVAELGDNALAVTTDVTEDGAPGRLVELALEAFGRLDLMVNNAGSADGGAGEAEPLSEFERVLALNLSSVFACCQAAAKAMLAAGQGSIVNIASVAALGSLSDHYPMAGYVASKHGVVGLTRELGAQWAGRGVRVNAIAPGWFPTELTGELRDADQVRWIERRTPMGRPGRLEDLDGAMIFLASDASAYIIGQTLVVDGGWTLW